MDAERAPPAAAPDLVTRAKVEDMRPIVRPASVGAAVALELNCDEWPAAAALEELEAFELIAAGAAVVPAAALDKPASPSGPSIVKPSNVMPLIDGMPAREDGANAGMPVLEVWRSAAVPLRAPAKLDGASFLEARVLLPSKLSPSDVCSARRAFKGSSPRRDIRSVFRIIKGDIHVRTNLIICITAISSV